MVSALLPSAARTPAPAAPSASISGPPALGATAEEQHQLKQAAEQFEAILLAHWWQQMRTSGLGSDADSDPTYSAINATGMEAVTMAMARSGGIGIARMLVHALEPAVGRAAGGGADNGQPRAEQRDTRAAVAALKSAAATPITPVKAEILSERQ
ncbi:MAG: hypothetical protein ACRD2F_04010 [Terriglobales bacterium]